MEREEPSAGECYQSGITSRRVHFRDQVSEGKEGLLKKKSKKQKLGKLKWHFFCLAKGVNKEFVFVKGSGTSNRHNFHGVGIQVQHTTPYMHGDLERNLIYFCYKIQLQY